MITSIIGPSINGTGTKISYDLTLLRGIDVGTIIVIIWALLRHSVIKTKFYLHAIGVTGFIFVAAGGIGTGFMSVPIFYTKTYIITRIVILCLSALFYVTDFSGQSRERIKYAVGKLAIYFILCVGVLALYQIVLSRYLRELGLKHLASVIVSEPSRFKNELDNANHSFLMYKRVGEMLILCVLCYLYQRVLKKYDALNGKKTEKMPC